MDGLEQEAVVKAIPDMVASVFAVLAAVSCACLLAGRLVPET